MGRFIRISGIFPLLLVQTAHSDLHPAIRNFDYMDPGAIAALPDRLSKAGLHNNIGSKARTLTDTSKYVFPEKTVLIKNFSIDTVYGDASTRILIETRFLVHSKTQEGVKWSGISYSATCG